MKLIIHTTASGGEQRIPVSSLKDAIQKWTDHQMGNNSNYDAVPASGMLGRNGDVIDNDDKMIATVSYNGRVWNSEKMELRV